MEADPDRPGEDTHGGPDGPAVDAAKPTLASSTPRDRPLSELERGIVVGVLLGEGHFGGDGKYPQITLRMHTRHEALFLWLQRLFPRARLYGPYHHGGRSYYQWMARGAALAEDVLPLVEEVLTDDLDAHVAGRVRDMRQRYADFFSRYTP